MQPCHTVCPDVPYVCCFEFTFSLTNLRLLFHSQDSAIRLSADATAEIVPKVNAASLNPPITQGTGTENDVSFGSNEGETLFCYDKNSFENVAKFLQSENVWLNIVSWTVTLGIVLEMYNEHRIGGCCSYIWIYYSHLLERNCVYYLLMKIRFERMFQMFALPSSVSFLLWRM